MKTLTALLTINRTQRIQIQKNGRVNAFSSLHPIERKRTLIVRDETCLCTYGLALTGGAANAQVDDIIFDALDVALV